MARKGAQTSTNKKTEKKKITIKINILFVIVLACFIYFAYTVITQEFRLNEYNVKIANMNGEIADAEQRIDMINKLKENVNDTSYIESIAREELGLVKPYEKIFVDVNQ